MGHDISFHTNWGNLSVRAAGIVLRNNRVLLAKGEKTPYYLVGGTTQLHENSHETVRRESYEELGIVVTVERLVFAISTSIPFGLRERQISASIYHELEFVVYLVGSCKILFPLLFQNE